MNVRYEQRPHQRLRGMLGGLLLLGTVVLALVVFTLSHGASAASGPDIEVSADPQQLSPGDTFDVRIRVTNPLTSTLSKMTVKLRYDSAQVTPIDSDFHHDSDWVSDLSSSRVTLTFKDIGAGKSRTGKVVFRVKPAIPGNTSVDLHAKFNWSVNASTTNPASSGSGSADGDDALIVAPNGVQTNPNLIDSVPQANIDPTVGVTGTEFHAHASGFRGGERISIWLNTPNGVAAVPHNLVANSNGEVWPEFSGDNLVAGSYGLVIYGQESTQTLVVPFTVGTSAVSQPVVAQPVVSQPAATQPAAQPATPPWTSTPPPLWAPPAGSPPAGPPPPAPSSTNIEPRAASAGTHFNAYANGFKDHEGVSIWLNTPSGVKALDGSFFANGSGEVWPDFSSDHLAAGSYELVIYGRDSGRTLVVPFTINS